MMDVWLRRRCVWLVRAFAEAVTAVMQSFYKVLRVVDCGGKRSDWGSW